MAKKVLITGANRGIGFETARQLGAKGWQILLGARNKERGNTAVQKLKGFGVSAEWIKIDLNDVETIQAAAEYVKSNHSDLKALINNAGVSGDMEKAPLSVTLDELREVTDVNFLGNFAMIKAFTPILAANRGRIMNLTIPLTINKYFHPFAYMTSKAPLNVMIKAFGYEFKKENIPVEIFGILPGGVTTDLNNHEKGIFMRPVSEGGKVVADTLLDGKNHQGKIVTKFGLWQILKRALGKRS
ncbi:putative oxidoreductase [Pediococcus damnosus]|uniref:Oxidoreductase n=1 Tax=Pediococcus damnosus TaxID=51663 RepID=A0A0R2H2A4_9LACO|nr:SDR family NAD(P)-dependent oxidoreductase [Pediococcus damnosus]AMV61986.1 putative oxidoreductase [Pediococcus damnosus]AMV66133.1 putative oxidoreductase [Pediococcus damnosus]AMV68421.1 putative oxidoreductase [Pediococcus damnosus]KJU74602.1 carbonyl reductase [Pediococcus damnosus LMG 28219]KRN44677.1 carbonyl reductase [Pediococcus damnosus]